MKKFKEEQEKNITKLNQYVPVVDRVHGDSHPEFHEVRRVYEKINNEIESNDYSNLNLDDEFRQLRTITSNYKIPSDTCETFEAVYNMLFALDSDYVENFQKK